MVGRLLEILSELAEEYELGAGGSASFSEGIHSETAGAIGASVSIIDGPDFSGGWLMGSVSGETARGGADGMVGWTPFWLGGALLALPVGWAFLRKYHALAMLISELIFPRGSREEVGSARKWATFLFCGVGAVVGGVYLVLISSSLLPTGQVLVGLFGILGIVGLLSRKNWLNSMPAGKTPFGKHSPRHRTLGMCVYLGIRRSGRIGWGRVLR